MLLGGRLADLLGARRVVLAGLLLFTVASLVTGLAQNAPHAHRRADRAGRSARRCFSPAALSVVTANLPGDELNKALGIWSALGGGGGSAVGVLLGGVLTGGPGWQWVFHINAPIGVIVLIALTRSTARRTRRRSCASTPGRPRGPAGHRRHRHGDLRADRRR